jgi:hypothetical protein
MGNLPEYNTTIAPDILTLNTRFKEHLRGVKSHIYFLKANIARMRDFCDHYLNFVSESPRAPIYFKPFLPFVVLGVLDYGSLSVEAQNMGWISQHEVWFALPLEWYSIRDGRPVFQDWALVCPFLFVDNTLSVATAREVQGFSKLAGSFRAAAKPRIFSPPQPVQSLNLSIKVAPGKYSTSDAEMRTLVEIYRESSGYAHIPPTLDDIGLDLPKMLARSVGTAAGVVDILAGLPIFGYERLRDLKSLARMGCRGMGYIASLLPKVLLQQPPLPEEPEAQRARTFWLNLTNLKQFRDAEQPDATCYQAIINSRMNVERYNSGGLLFNPLKDLTGGFRIRIHRGLSQPIIESLGLEVSEETTIESATAATLRPLYPLWLDVDVGYGTRRALCWRTKHSTWHTSNLPGHPVADANAYNTTQGVALAELPGAFRFPNSTFRVLPLIGDEKKLQQFCTKYLDNDYYRFKPWGSYIYLMVGSHEDVSSETESLGSFAFREVSFVVPVRWCDRNGKLLGVAMVVPFGYLDDETVTITEREVYGAAVTEASIESPPNTWLNDRGPVDTDQSLLKLDTIVLPALRLGRRAEQRRLLEIWQGESPFATDTPTLQCIAEGWGPQLIADHQKKVTAKKTYPADLANLIALSLEPLANGECVNTIALKQIRDAWDPNRACYQADVLTSRSIEHVFDIREIDQQLHVRIARYPTQPIVELLGLKTKWTDSSSAEATFDVLQPIRPFWMKVAFKQEPARNLCWRAGTTQWTKEFTPSFYFGRGKESATRVGEPVLHALEEARSRNKDPMAAARKWCRAAVLEDAAAMAQALAADRPNGLAALTTAIANAKEDDAVLLTKFRNLFEAEISDESGANRAAEWLGGSFSSAELGRLIELLCASGIQRQGDSLSRLRCGEASQAVENLEPQMAVECILSRYCIEQDSELDSARRANLDFPVRVDSIAQAFRNSVFVTGKFTDNGKFYSEEKTDSLGKNAEGTKRRK